MGSARGEGRGLALLNGVVVPTGRKKNSYKSPSRYTSPKDRGIPKAGSAASRVGAGAPKKQGQSRTRPNMSVKKSAVAKKTGGGSKPPSARSGMAVTRAKAASNRGALVESPMKPTNRPKPPKNVRSSSRVASKQSKSPYAKNRLTTGGGMASSGGSVTNREVTQKDVMWVLPQKKNGKVVKRGFLTTRRGPQRGKPYSGKVRITEGTTFPSEKVTYGRGGTKKPGPAAQTYATYKYGRNVNNPKAKSESTGRARYTEKMRAKNKAATTRTKKK